MFWISIRICFHCSTVNKLLLTNYSKYERNLQYLKICNIKVTIIQKTDYLFKKLVRAKAYIVHLQCLSNIDDIEPNYLDTSTIYMIDLLLSLTTGQQCSVVD